MITQYFHVFSLKNTNFTASNLSTKVDEDSDERLAGAPAAVHHLDAILRQAQAARACLEAAAVDSRVFCAGGDCGGEVLPVSFANRAWPRLALVWFYLS